MLALSRTTSPTAYRPMHRRTGLGAARTPADFRLRMVVRSAGPEKQHKQQRQRAMSEELERAVSVAKGLAAQQAEVVQAEQGRSKALARFEQALLQQLAMMQQEAARDARQLRDLVEQSSQARQESLEALQQSLVEGQQQSINLQQHTLEALQQVARAVDKQAVLAENLTAAEDHADILGSWRGDQMLI